MTKPKIPTSVVIEFDHLVKSKVMEELQLRGLPVNPGFSIKDMVKFFDFKSRKFFVT